jgi:hypothetical protein
MYRRSFLQYSAASSASLLFSSLEKFAEHQPIKIWRSYQLKVLATNFEGSTDALRKSQGAGYDGIEVWWHPNPA